jgi:ParB/RepB/Spo0J family partition protein
VTRSYYESARSVIEHLAPGTKVPALAELDYGCIIGQVAVVDCILPGGYTVDDSGRDAGAVRSAMHRARAHRTAPGPRHPRHPQLWHFLDQYGYLLENRRALAPNGAVQGASALVARTARSARNTERHPIPMNAPAETTPALVAVPLEQIALGKNYRHRRPANWEEKLDELGESMKQNGQLEPVLLRERSLEGERHFEVVFGERRYRAAKKAGLETLLAIVRDVADDQVLELQLSENGDREDAHPLDEAEAFEALVKRGRTPAEIAATRGRDVSYVLRRLALCKLSEKVRKAFDRDEVTFGVALLIAALPDQKTQEDALEECGFAAHDHTHITVAGAREAIERRVLARLSEAPFKHDDATLLPAAGACTTCPKRTGAQGALFETKTKDLCTDTACFRAKVDADWAARSKAHKANGGEILAVGIAKSVFGGYNHKDHEIRRRYAKLDEEVYVGNRRKPLRALFGKELPPVILARNPETGEAVELVAKKDAEAVERAANPKDTQKVHPATTAANRRERLKDLARTEATRRATADLVAKVEHIKAWEQLGTKFLLPFARCVIESTWHDGRSALVKRRDWDKAEVGEELPKPKKGARGAMRAIDMTEVLKERLERLDAKALAGVVVELVISRGAPAKYSGEPGDEWAGLAESLGVYYDRILANVVEDQAAAEKANGAKAPKGKPAKKAPKKRKAAR